MNVNGFSRSLNSCLFEQEADFINRHILAVPGANSAYIRGAVAVFKGSVGNPSVFQHEIGHAMDSYNNAVGSSTTTTWDTAIRNDTCVPDSYANTSM